MQPARLTSPTPRTPLSNYLLDAETRPRKITEEIQYPTPNEAARALMPDSYKNNPVIFPSPEIMAVSE